MQDKTTVTSNAPALPTTGPLPAPSHVVVHNVISLRDLTLLYDVMYHAFEVCGWRDRPYSFSYTIHSMWSVWHHAVVCPSVCDAVPKITTVTVHTVHWRHCKSCEESFEATLKNRHRGCGLDNWGRPWNHIVALYSSTIGFRDGQTVPRTGSSNRKGPIADGGQPCTIDIQRQWGSRWKASPGLEIGRVLESRVIWYNFWEDICMRV